MSLNEETHPIAEHALAYLQAGWKLVMMDHGTKGPTHDGWNSPSELVDSPERAISRLRNGPQNMGVQHQASGTCAIDVDDEAWTREIWAEFGIDYDDILGRGMRIYSKPNRDKVIFRAPDLPLLKVQWPTPNATRITDRQTVFELRAGPNQDVLPPSRHPDGHNYVWRAGQSPWDFAEAPEIPENLLQFWRAIADRDSGVRDAIANMCPWKQAPQGKRFVQRPRAPSEHGDVIGAYNQVTDVGDLLERHGYKKKGRRYLAPSSSTVIPGVVILEGKCYSHHGSDPLADGYAHDAFDLLCTLDHNGDVGAAIRDAASQLGLERKQPVQQPDMVLDLEAVMAAQAKRKAAAAERQEPFAEVSIVEQLEATPTLTKTLPKKLLRAPGVFGEVVDWMIQTAQYPQPELAVAATLSLFGTVLGQKVRNWSGLRTNFYLASIAGTSAGKEHGRKCIKRLLSAAGMMDNLGGDKIASGAGLLQALTRCPNTLLMQDEFGMKLAGWTGKKAPTHLRDIVENLLSLFGQADEIVAGTERADAKNNPRQDIHYPCLNVYGTTTDNIWAAVSGEDVSSGFLNRLLIVQAGEKPQPQRSSIGEPPPRVIDWIKAARGMHQGMMGLDAASPITIPDHPMAETLFTQFLAWVNKHIVELEKTPGKELLAPLWGRAAEHAMKVALVLSCTKFPDAAALTAAAEGGGLEVDHGSAEWAIEFVRFALETVESEVATRVGDSDFDRLCQEASRVVRAAGVKGRTLGEMSAYCRSFKALDPVMQDRVLEGLKRREDVFIVQFKTMSGRSRLARVSREWISQIEEAGGSVVTGETTKTAKGSEVLA